MKFSYDQKVLIEQPHVSFEAVGTFFLNVLGVSVSSRVWSEPISLVVFADMFMATFFWGHYGGGWSI